MASRSRGMAPMTARLLVDRISRRFGARHVLRDVSFEACAGELVLISGSNGSGKSTLFEVITGQIAADRGRIELTGRKLPVGPALVVWERIHRRPEAWMRVCRQSAPLFASLTLADHARLSRITPGGAASAQPVAVLSGYLRDRRLPLQMSFGERRAFALERQLAAAPLAVCLLDEPFAGLDERNGRLLEDQLRRAKDGGAIVVVIEHASNIPRFGHLIDRAYHLQDGTLHETRPTVQSATVPGGVGPAGISIERAGRRTAGDVSLTVSVETDNPDACPPLFAQFADAPLTLQGGETVRIRAPNGWGKSTLCEAMAGVRTAFPARVALFSDGSDLTSSSPERRHLAGIRFMPTSPRYPARTAVRSVYSAAGVAPSERTRPLMKRRLETLSGGEMRFVALELALRSGGVHCILDEPLLGLDQAARTEAEAMFESFSGAGGLLILEPGAG